MNTGSVNGLMDKWMPANGWMNGLMDQWIDGGMDPPIQSSMNPLIHSPRHPFIQRGIRAADLPLEQLAGNSKLSEAEKVAEVSRQFEAVLLRQILGDAQKPAFASTMNPRSVASGVYQDMITQQLADSISRSGAFGLANSIKPQLEQALKPPRVPRSELPVPRNSELGTRNSSVGGHSKL